MHRTLSLLAEVNSQAICHIMSSVIARDSRAHRTRTIQHNEAIALDLRQVLPHSLQLILNAAIYIVMATSILMNDLIRHKHRRVHLCFAAIHLLNVLSITLRVMTQESLTILQIRLRRQILVGNIAPVVINHLTLNNANLTAQSTAHTRVLSIREVHPLSQVVRTHLNLLIRSAQRREPLTQQRHALAGTQIVHIRVQLLDDKIVSFVTNATKLHQVYHVVPTTELRQKVQNLLEDVRLFPLKPLVNSTRNSTLTHAATHITAVEQPTHSQHRVLGVSFLKMPNSLRRIVSVRGSRKVQVYQLATSSLESDSTILSNRNVIHLNYLRYIHNILSHKNSQLLN